MFSYLVNKYPDVPEFHQNLGYVLFHLGDQSGGLVELGKAVGLDQQAGSAWCTLGAMYQAKGCINEALACYERFLANCSPDEKSSQIKELKAALIQEQEIQANLQNQTKLAWNPENLPLRVFVAQPSFEEIHLKKISVSILKSAFERWAKCVRSKAILVFVNSPVGADIVCDWVFEGKAKLNPLEPGECAYTSVDGEIRNCLIKIMVGKGDLETKMSRHRFYRVCLHEAGHALGLRTHSSSPSDVMFYSCVLTQAPALSARDRQAMNFLYK